MMKLNMNTNANTKNGNNYNNIKNNNKLRLLLFSSSLLLSSKPPRARSRAKSPHRDVEGATYTKMILLIINVTSIITIIVYTRVAQEYQYTPNLQHLV